MGPILLDRDRLIRLRASSDANRSNIAVGVALLHLAHHELEAFSAGGSERTSEEGICLVLCASRQVLDRVGLSLDLPFSVFRTFRSYWVANDGYGSWQALRDILGQLFKPVHIELARRDDGDITSTLARPVTSHPGTGWSQVDDDVNELRRHFQLARSEQDYRNIGNDYEVVAMLPSAPTSNSPAVTRSSRRKNEAAL